jgi:signal peptidase I
VPAGYQKVKADLAQKYWKHDGVKRNFFLETIAGRRHLITVIPSRRYLGSDFGPLRVPKDHYFMLGDNRDNSADSRYIGPVHRKYILGKAVSVVLSFSRTDRFFQGLR